jgi:hypothetical protein
MEYEKFTSLIKEYAEGHDVTDIVVEVRKKFGTELAVITPYIVDEAIMNFVQKLRRRKAKLEVSGHGDLFSEFSVRAMVTKTIVDADGRKKQANIWQHHLTKSDLKSHIDRLVNRPNRESRELHESKRLLEAIDRFCADDETIEIALRRRKGM